MAALKGGTTVHGWGKVPVNLNAVQEIASSKGKPQIDDLFERAQSIRWLLIDEISTLGPLVLGVFDTNLAVIGCSCHP